ncbi:MAG: hypothetical protein AAGA75_04785 [Cyanobacteria bacterium P01_E01_bin.6]
MSQHPSNEFDPQRSNPSSPHESGETSPSHGQLPSQPSSVPGWQTVEFPNAISADASQRQALYTQSMTRKSAPSSRANSSGRSPKSGASDPKAAQSAEGLIALIQDANQRNHELMSRIAQLEEALEESRQALQLQLDGAEDADEDDQSGEISSDAAQQVSYLLNQLEFAQQANQRQEILVETLTGQLQASQERVTQLETDCQQFQQTISTQSTQIQQGDRQTHDLQTRLQRQQQYTLQFKVALEKCLEVPPPSYETDVPPVDEIQSVYHSTTIPQSVTPHIPVADIDDISPVHESGAAAETQLPESRPSAAQPVNYWGGTLRDSSKLTDSLFPKVNHIKPWSVDAPGIEPKDSAHPTGDWHVEQSTPSDTVEASSVVSPASPGLFSSKFYDTLLELAQTDLTQPVDHGRSPEPPVVSEVIDIIDNTASTSLDVSSLSDSSLSDSAVTDSTVTNSAVNERTVTDSSDGLDAMPSEDIESDHNAEITPSAQSQPESATPPEAEPTWFRWRSLMPPDLRALGDRDDASDVGAADDGSSSDSVKPSTVKHHEARLPGEPISPGTHGIGTSFDGDFLDTDSFDTDSPDPEVVQEEAQANDGSSEALANLVRATADEIARAQQASDFSGFTGFSSESPAPTSLTEVFLGSSDSEPQSGDSDLPFDLTVRGHQEAHLNEVSPDPWKTTPGSYFSEPTSSAKLASIPPFSVAANSQEKDTLLAIANRTSPNPSDDSLAPHEASPAVVETPAQPTDNLIDSAVSTMDSGSDQHDKEQPQGAIAPEAVEADASPPVPEAVTDTPASSNPSQEASLYTPANNIDAAQKRASLSSLVFSVSPSVATPDAADSSGIKHPQSVPSMAQSQSPAPIPVKPLSAGPVNTFRADGNNPNWPAPLLSPLKATDKQESKKAGAVIDLPAFLR